MGQLGSIVLPGLNGFIGEINDLLPIRPEKPDDPICSRNEPIAQIDRAI
jgi:hypothetical protein